MEAAIKTYGQETVSKVLTLVSAIGETDAVYVALLDAGMDYEASCLWDMYYAS